MPAFDARTLDVKSGFQSSLRQTLAYHFWLHIVSCINSTFYISVLSKLILLNRSSSTSESSSLSVSLKFVLKSSSFSNSLLSWPFLVVTLSVLSCPLSMLQKARVCYHHSLLEFIFLLNKYGMEGRIFYWGWKGVGGGEEEERDNNLKLLSRWTGKI